MTWFVEIKSPLGRWMPTLHHGEKPSPQTVDGKRTFRADPVKVHPALADQPLDLLALIYGQDGALNGIDPVPFAAFLNQPGPGTFHWRAAA